MNEVPILWPTRPWPKKLNACTSAMGRELIHVFDRVDKHNDVRAIIVTGEWAPSAPAQIFSREPTHLIATRSADP